MSGRARAGGSASRAGAPQAVSRAAGEARRARWYRRRRPLFALFTLVLLVVGIGVWALWFSTLLVLRGVTVTGSTILPAAEVRQVAGLSLGRPLVALDLDAARLRLAGLPSVAQVTVRRVWPHAVRIRVVEREAVAVMPAAGGFAEVDRDGVRFNTVHSAPAGVPLIIASPGATHDALDAAIAVAVALPRGTVRQVASISASGPNDVSVTLVSGAVAHWGDPSNTGRKAQVLGLLLRYGARSYDVSAPDAPAYR